MKLRRIFAALAACAIAATSVISASAADFTVKGADGDTGKPAKDDPYAGGAKVWQMVGYEKDAFIALFTDKVITKVEVEISLSNGGELQIGASKNDGAKYPWLSKDVKDIPAGEKTTLTLEPETDGLGLCPDSIGIGFNWIQPTYENGVATTGGVFTFYSAKIYGADGALLFDSTNPPAANNNTNNSSNNSSNNNGDKKDNSNKPTGASAGLALAGLALAGVAVVATKKSK